MSNPTWSQVDAEYNTSKSAQTSLQNAVTASSTAQGALVTAQAATTTAQNTLNAAVATFNTGLASYLATGSPIPSQLAALFNAVVNANSTLITNTAAQQTAQTQADTAAASVVTAKTARDAAVAQFMQDYSSLTSP